MTKIHFTNRLYFKISMALLLILGALGLGYLGITTYAEQAYFKEVNQRLYGSIADHTVTEVKPFVNGEVDTTAIQDIMHSMMVINPNVEVYLLDTLGNIITYVAPYKKIKRKKVNLAPIEAFMTKDETAIIEGDDPRNPEGMKVFSAAPITENDRLLGYVYIILASEEQAAVTSSLYESHVLRLSSQIFLFTLLGALIIGLLAIWFLTRNLRRLVYTVQRFKEGDLHARVAPEDRGDLGVLADAFNEMADQILANIENIKSVETLRRELIANVSHDLRTPLAIQQGYAETLLMKDEQLSTKDRKKYLEIILSSSNRLSKLVQQLFEYSKLEANQVEPQKEPFFIGELAQDVFQKYQILAEQKNIELQLNIPHKLPMVFADLALVERVIQNLMDNALKFTPDGGGIQLKLEEQDQHIMVRVIDDGPGIPEHEQQHIFERYRQTEKGKQYKQGTGLGLAIAKKIMEIHNSTI
ncbi:MAG: HAMP domain-containing histidine kinase, partial [Saprospiraceae bacterium]|nr:HAMP domain-containing histidine kinase [Saprospiraceae bacterium]